MPDIGALTRNGDGRRSPTKDPTHRLATIASDPSNASDPVFVTIKSMDKSETLLWGPCPWAPRILDATTYGLPSKGDMALVVFTEEEEPWVVEWWPYAL